MARNKGNLIQCLESISGHLAPYHAGLLVQSGSNDQAGLMRRFEIIDAEVRAAIDRIQKIKSALVRQGRSDVAALLEETFEYGTD